jgi:hypothetical protein
MPSGRVLVAVQAGKARAAIGVDDGVLVADPFVATRPLADLLRLRALQLRQEDARRPRRGLLLRRRPSPRPLALPGPPLGR